MRQNTKLSRFTLVAPSHAQLARPFLNLQRRMEDAGHDGQSMTQKKSELEELRATNTIQELRYAGMLLYHNAIRSLHGKMQEDYNVKRAKYIELKAELIRHHEKSIKQRRTIYDQLTQGMELHYNLKNLKS